MLTEVSITMKRKGKSEGPLSRTNTKCLIEKSLAMRATLMFSVLFTGPFPIGSMLNPYQDTEVLTARDTKDKVSKI